MRHVTLYTTLTLAFVSHAALAIPNISFQNPATGLDVQARAHAGVSSFNFGSAEDAPAIKTFHSSSPFDNTISNKTLTQSASAHNAIFPNIFSSASSTANFTLTETADTDRLSGCVSGVANYGTNAQPGWGFSQLAVTQLTLVFEVVTPVKYDFVGNLSIASTQNGDGGDSISELLGDTQLFSFEQKITNGQTLSQPVASNGILMPGFWRFSVYAQPFWKGTTTTTFDLKLSSAAPVPEPSSSILIGFGVCLTIAARRMAKRRDRDSR